MLSPWAGAMLLWKYELDMEKSEVLPESRAEVKPVETKPSTKYSSRYQESNKGTLPFKGQIVLLDRK